jgi:hypothetical protein
MTNNTEPDHRLAKVVSASKPKAKSSPGKDQNSPELRKATDPRVIKKLFHSARDSVSGEHCILETVDGD